MTEKASRETWDVAVIGAGIVGSISAYNLLLRGQKTLLLEQYSLLHPEGSSCSHTRVLNHSFDLRSFYIHMVRDSIPVWQHLGCQTDSQVYRETGILSIGSEEVVEEIDVSLSRENIPCHRISREELLSLYPMIRVKNNQVGIKEKGGIVYAARALMACHVMIKKLEGTVVEKSTVSSITPGNITVLTTSTGEYRAKKVVVAVGPWAPTFLKRLGVNWPIECKLAGHLYWREKIPGTYGIDKVPIVIITGVGSSIPSAEYPGLFKCGHFNQSSGIPASVENYASAVTKYKETEMRKARQNVVDSFPYLDSSGPEHFIKCFYTTSEDNTYIIDTHPQWPQIIISTGFSGHGFATAPATGKIITALVLEESPPYDIQHFRADRFDGKSKM